MTNYGSLVGGSLAFAGVDQGIDFTGAGPIFALGNGVVTRVVRGGSGWSGDGWLLVYKITSGSAKGRYVYLAEDFRTNLKVGAKVRAGQQIGQATGSGHAPGIETGWANANGQPVAPLHPNPHGPKAAGQDFNSFVLGAKTVGTAVGSAGAAIGAQPAKAISHVGPQQILPEPVPTPNGDMMIGDFRMPGVAPPPTAPFSPRHFAEMWDQIARQPNASPETRLYAQNAGVIAGADSATERAA